MTEDLRALLRADLNADRPPPLGDVVGAALRDGRRIRRRRRQTVVAGVAAVVVFASGGALHRGLSPQTVPLIPAAPAGAPSARTLTIHSATGEAVGLRKKATAAAMLHLLTTLLPPGRTSGYAAPDDLSVQLYLDEGAGPGMVRVAVTKAGNGGEPARRAAVEVTVHQVPGDCGQSTAVDAAWPDGTVVRVGVATCLPVGGRPTRPALTADEAVRVAADPRWGVTMDERLIASGARQFPRLPR